MAGIRLEGNTSGNVAEVNSSNQLKVVGETNVASNPGNVGAVRLFSESDPGAVTGVASLLSPEVSGDYRLRVGQDVLLDSDTFSYTSQNTGRYRYVFTTLTMSQNSGSLQTNNGGITTINTAAAFRSWQTFSLLGQQTPLTVEFSAAITAARATNSTVDFGMFITTGPDTSPYVPADGVYFRITSAGVFGVVNNGSETLTSAFTTDGVTPFSPTINQVYQFVIAITERKVEFWIDDVLYATTTTPVGVGQPFQSSSLPMQIRHAIGGTAASAAFSLRFYDYSVQLGDLPQYPVQTLAARQGGSLQIQNGGTASVGQLSTYALGAAPSAVTLTASTAPATNTLGGLFLLPAAITAGESDYPLFAWSNPAATILAPGKIFMCTGIIVSEALVATVLAGGPIAICYAIGFGSTAATLATTESASFATGTTKISRKYPLGVQGFAATAAAGTVVAGFQRDFSNAPIPVNPGEILHCIIRAIGTSTSSGAIRGGVTFIGYFV
jgi:hypothetical protein